MIAIPIKNVQASIAALKPEIDAFANRAAKRLIEYFNNPERTLNADEIIYLKALIKEIKNLVIAEPDILENHCKNFYKIPIRITRKYKFVKGKKKLQSFEDLTFRDNILEKLDYETLRSKLLPKYFSNIGIKACIYCNSVLTVSVNSYGDLNNKKNFIVKAKFQADHAISKSEYPSLSISLFNLYPVCGSCNNVKGKTVVPFKLYSSDISDTSKSDYFFEMKKGCVAKYLISKDPNDLIFYFKDPLKIDRAIISKGSFQDTFDIEGIYETQIDIIEELIYKSEVYKDSYKKKLTKSFQKLFTNASLSNRILVGNYTSPEEIHKRPMAKFTQDIAKQLGLI